MSREIFEQVQRCTSGTASSCFCPEVALSDLSPLSEPACVSPSDAEAAGLRQVQRGGLLCCQGDDERAHTRSHSSLSSGNNFPAQCRPRLFPNSVCVCSPCWCSCPRTTQTTPTTWAVCSTRTASTRRPAGCSPRSCS